MEVFHLALLLWNLALSLWNLALIAVETFFNYPIETFNGTRADSTGGARGSSLAISRSAKANGPDKAGPPPFRREHVYRRMFLTVFAATCAATTSPSPATPAACRRRARRA